MLKWILFVVSEIFFAMSMHIFYKVYFQAKISTGKIILSWAVYLVVINTSNIVLNTMGLNLLVVFVYSLFISNIIYIGKLQKKMIITFFLIALNVLVEVIVVSFFTYFVDSEINDLISDSYNVIILSSYSKFVLYLHVKIVSIIYNKKSGSDSRIVNALVVIVTPIGSVFITLYEIITSESVTIPILSLIILIIINICVVYFYEEIQNKLYVEVEKAVLLQQFDYYQKNYRELEISYNNIRTFKHDIKNHLVAMTQYAKLKNYDMLVQYIEEISGEVSKDFNIIHTCNINVDSILNYKIGYAREKRIKFKYNVNIPMELDIGSADLCVILGNIVDNAIEAVELLNEEERIIDLSIELDLRNLIISISNSYNGELNKTFNGVLLTTKKDKINHGIGIKSVKKIIEKYNGIMEIENENHTFHITILLYNVYIK